MTQQEARAFVETVQAEIPAVFAIYGKRQDHQEDTSYVVRLQHAGRILTAYKLSQWQEIKWAWGLEDAVKPPPVYYQVQNRVMTFYQSKGYWYGQFTHNDKKMRQYFGRSDPREQYQIVYKKEEEITV